MVVNFRICTVVDVRRRGLPRFDSAKVRTFPAEQQPFLWFDSIVSIEIAHKNH